MLLAVTVIAMAVLYWFSEQPIVVGLLAHPYDKLAHAAIGMLLTLLVWFGLGQRWWYAIGLLMSVLFALEEWHQSFLPGRVPDSMDFIVASASAWLLLVMLHFRHLLTRQLWAR